MAAAVAAVWLPALSASVSALAPRAQEQRPEEEGGGDGGGEAGH